MLDTAAPTDAPHNSSLYEEIPGFDTESGDSYVYPINYTLRDYQYNIVKKCCHCSLFKNTLVCLPTGLGKTFTFSFSYSWPCCAMKKERRRRKMNSNRMSEAFGVYSQTKSNIIRAIFAMHVARDDYQLKAKFSSRNTTITLTQDDLLLVSTLSYC